MKIIHPDVSYVSLSSVSVGDCFLRSGNLFLRTNGYLTEFTLSFSHNDDKSIVCVNLGTGRILLNTKTPLKKVKFVGKLSYI